MRLKILLFALVLSLCTGSISAAESLSSIENPQDREATFFYDFSDRGEAAFEYDWLVIDANGDGQSWQYSPWTMGIDGIEGAAACYGCYEGDMTNNDYMVTSQPLRLEAGDHHIAFYARAGYGDAVERLEILYAETADINDMREIGSLELSGPDWATHLINFNIPTAGSYHVAFRNRSVEGGMTCIDNVSVCPGYTLGEPDLRIARLLLPVSNCDLSAESRIGAAIHNFGTKESEYFTLKCDINNGEQNIEERFTEKIAPGLTKVVYFDQTADFADIGVYTVVVDGDCAGCAIGQQRAEVSSLIPATLPLISDFSNDVLREWYEVEGGNWAYDDFGRYWQGEPGGESKALISRCFEADKALRVRISYGCSDWGVGQMHIAMGKAGSDRAFYQTVYQDECFSGTKDVEFDVNISEPDHYCLMIVNDGTDEWDESLWLKAVAISVVNDSDVAITEVNACLSTYTPLDQFSSSLPITATVANRGLNAFAGLKVSAILDGVTVGETSLGRTLNTGETTDIKVLADFSDVAVTDELHISIVAEGSDIDENIADNTFSLRPVHVTSTLRANEHITEYDLGVGEWGAQLSIGNVYSLACDDVLTSLEIGLTHTEELLSREQEIRVSVYELADNTTLGRCLFTQKAKRGAGGLMTIALDPMYLSIGSYYFEVSQLSNSNMGLVYEYAEGNTCYQRDGEHISRLDNGLALAVRAVFDDACVPESDVAVTSIVSPAKAEGLYAPSQSISACIKNKGRQQADFSAACLVNGRKVSDVCGSLLPYEQKVYDFGTYDMSEQGKYTIEVSTSMAGDENAENDRLSTQYVAVAEQHPYVMDFEYCDDFDGADEVLNPRWRTVDRHGCETDGFWQYSYPHHSMPVGFIAFNPDATVPSMSDNGFEGFYPHSGRRFGAAFASVGDSTHPVDHSDVWLISPKLQLGEGSSLELYVKTRSLEWADQPLEPFQILVSEADDDFESFVVVGDECREAPAEHWERVTVDMSQFDGQAVHLAIRYIGRPFENVVLMVDDIRVLTSISSAVDLECSDIEVTYRGGMATVCAKSQIENITMHDISGREMWSVSPKAYDCEISMHMLSAGVYIISATTRDSHTTATFTVCRAY